MRARSTLTSKQEKLIWAEQTKYLMTLLSHFFSLSKLIFTFWVQIFGLKEDMRVSKQYFETCFLKEIRLRKYYVARKSTKIDQNRTIFLLTPSNHFFSKVKILKSRFIFATPREGKYEDLITSNVYFKHVIPIIYHNTSDILIFFVFC